MRKTLLVYALLLSGTLASAQRITTFVKLPGNLGYVIDSSENVKKELITFLPSKQFHSGALIQLPDSSIVFRIILSGTKTTRNLNFSKETANNFLKKIAQQNAVGDTLPETNETNQIKEIADSNDSIKFTQLENLIEMHYVTQQQTEIFEDDSLASAQSTFAAIEVGLGTGQVKSGDGGTATGVKMTIINEHYTYGIRYCGVRNVMLFGGPDEYSHDVSLLAGINILNDNIYFSAMTGLSYVSHQFRGPLISSLLLNAEYETLKYRSVGIPIDLQIDLFPHSRVGIDLQFFSSINNYSYWGALFSIRVGRLLPPKKKK